MNKTLLIMAAGMGSRFGGLKQIEPFGPNGEFIIDYSIYDAIKCGFNKIVFIIKEENYDLFRDTVGKRIEDKIKVEYVFQSLDNLPKGYTKPENRVKPWGTAHAILCAKDVIDGPFAVINSDDFYGRDAYNAASKFIDHMSDNEYSIVGYDVVNTLTENGSVKRGVCFTENGKLEKLVESKIEKDGLDIICEPLNGSDKFEITSNTKVSMNMMVLNDKIFDYIEKKFTKFLEFNKNNLEICEFFIPDILTSGINEKIFSVKVVDTTAKWAGVTYKEDKDKVVSYINGLIDAKEYPQKLWN